MSHLKQEASDSSFAFVRARHAKEEADITLRSKNKENALDVAIRAENEACAMALIKHKDWEKALRNKIDISEGYVLAINLIVTWIELFFFVFKHSIFFFSFYLFLFFCLE